MGRLDYIADVLLLHGMLTKHEMEDCRCFTIPMDRARVLIDIAGRKGNAASYMFMEAWDNYKPPVNQQTSTTHLQILHILKNLTSDDLRELKFFLRFTDIDDQEPMKVTTMETDDRIKLAEAICMHYADKAKKALSILLGKINRNDLIEELDALSSGSSKP